jgi:hypothetical protein
MVSLHNIILAATALSVASAQWVSFCDDSDCTTNCGEAVDATNPGCLNEVGRGSFYYQGGLWEDVSLVVSPGSDCPCQDTCFSALTVDSTAGCYALEGVEGAQSFRFIGSSCEANNCGAY